MLVTAGVSYERLHAINSEAVSIERDSLPGVYLANMAHVYPQDRGQNYSLRLGERMARLMTTDRSR